MTTGLYLVTPRSDIFLSLARTSSKRGTERKGQQPWGAARIAAAPGDARGAERGAAAPPTGAGRPHRPLPNGAGFSPGNSPGKGVRALPPRGAERRVPYARQRRRAVEGSPPGVQGSPDPSGLSVPTDGWQKQRVKI